MSVRGQPFDFSSGFSDEALAAVRDGMRETMAGLPRTLAEGAKLVPEKLSCLIQVPDELLMDAGVIPDTRIRKQPSRRTRLRWRIDASREYVARWVYRRLTGEDVPEIDY